MLSKKRTGSITPSMGDIEALLPQDRALHDLVGTKLEQWGLS